MCEGTLIRNLFLKQAAVYDHKINKREKYTYKKAVRLSERLKNILFVSLE